MDEEEYDLADSNQHTQFFRRSQDVSVDQSKPTMHPNEACST